MVLVDLFQNEGMSPRVLVSFFLKILRPPISTLFPYTTLFRSEIHDFVACFAELGDQLLFETVARSEEHTSELQSHVNLVCRLLLEKKKPMHDTDSLSAS